MSYKKPSRTILTFSWIPLAVNFLIFCLAFIPATKDYVFCYFEEGGVISFGGWYLRFASHIISLLYLIWLLYSSISLLRGKHIQHAMVLIVCATFVVVSVVIESFFNSAGEIHLLNSTIAVSAMTYYLFLYMEKSQVDTLTGLFNRETYYADFPRMEKTMTGVIQFDMNGLKYINDNFGHLEGDEALATIASCIMHCTKSGMYAYRLGGDEFLVLVNKRTEQEIIAAIEKFKNDLHKTKYHCSVGYSYRKDKTVSGTDLLKQAEFKMYLDKEEFYKNANFERRKALHS